MKSAKYMAVSAIVVLGLAAVLVYLLLGNLDSLVENFVEEVGTEMAGSEVSLDAVHLDLPTGRGELIGLVIANPPGYDSDFAMRIKRVVLAIDPASIAGPVLKISEVSIKGAQLNAEQKGDRNNLAEILESIERAGGGGDKPTQPDAEGAESDVRLYVQRFVFAGSKAKLLLPGQKPVTIKVPDVRRKGIGDPQQGLPPEELGNQIARAVIEEAQKAVTAHLAGMAVDAAKDKLKEKLGLGQKKR